MDKKGNKFEPTAYPVKMAVEFEIKIIPTKARINFSTPDLKLSNEEKIKLKIINGNKKIKTVFIDKLTEYRKDFILMGIKGPKNKGKIRMQSSKTGSHPLAKKRLIK